MDMMFQLLQISLYMGGAPSFLNGFGKRKLYFSGFCMGIPETGDQTLIDPFLRRLYTPEQYIGIIKR